MCLIPTLYMLLLPHRLEYQRRNSAKESMEIVVHKKDKIRRESEKNGSPVTTPL